ncbi:MAG: hypothetical protein ACRCSV_03600 [Chlamydiales bacterium]
MTINNFNYIHKHQNEPLDLRINISLNETNSTGLEVTGRIVSEAMNVLMGYDEEVCMEISEPAISTVDIPMIDSHFPSLSQGNFEVNNNANLQKDARWLELRKEIIGSEKIDSHGNIISLDFSKRFIHKGCLLEEIFQNLTQIFGREDIL